MTTFGCFGFAWFRTYTTNPTHLERVFLLWLKQKKQTNEALHEFYDVPGEGTITTCVSVWLEINTRPCKTMAKHGFLSYLHMNQHSLYSLCCEFGFSDELNLYILMRITWRMFSVNYNAHWSHWGDDSLWVKVNMVSEKSWSFIQLTKWYIIRSIAKVTSGKLCGFMVFRSSIVFVIRPLGKF